ncbi:MAG TPA: ABC transporter permease subunit [Ilumatobacter sp.]|nr:ABC transporter permease subunit [Ilumatobacter sp.]
MTPPRPDRRRLGRGRILVIQALIIAVFLLLWEYLPQYGPARNSFRFLDPFFISSPSKVAKNLRALAVGDNTVLIWPYFWASVKASITGVFVGTFFGALAGLVLSNSQVLNAILRPFLVALNAVPRVALIPVIVLICGPTQRSSVITAVLVIFFLVFFNAFEGGRSVPAEVVQNARLLGASRRDVLFRIRARYVLGWTFAALPNAVSFGFISVVTSEILTGTRGLGRLIADSLSTIQPALTFSVVFILSAVGLVLTLGVEYLNRRLMHWWTQDDSAT